MANEASPQTDKAMYTACHIAEGLARSLTHHQMAVSKRIHGLSMTLARRSASKAPPGLPPDRLCSHLQDKFFPKISVKFFIKILRP
jgi:hypothetical protein